jgi:hypothetical protein
VADGIAAKIRAGAVESSRRLSREAKAQLFNFQWLARPDARSLLLLFTQGSPHRPFINRLFFEQSVRAAIADAALKHPVSRQWKGYWQRFAAFRHA